MSIRLSTGNNVMDIVSSWKFFSKIFFYLLVRAWKFLNSVLRYKHIFKQFFLINIIWKILKVLIVLRWNIERLVKNKFYYIWLLLLSVVISATDLIQSVVWSVVLGVLTYLYHIPMLICYYIFSTMYVELTTFKYKLDSKHFKNMLHFVNVLEKGR